MVQRRAGRRTSTRHHNRRSPIRIQHKLLRSPPTHPSSRPPHAPIFPHLLHLEIAESEEIHSGDPPGDWDGFWKQLLTEALIPRMGAKDAGVQELVVRGANRGMLSEHQEGELRRFVKKVVVEFAGEM